MHQTLDDIRREGLSALRQRLGRSGLVRFLQQFELGSGDYARQRRPWADRQTLDDFRQLAQERRPRRAAKKRQKAARPKRARDA